MVRRVDDKDKPMMPAVYAHPSHKPFAPSAKWHGPTEHGKRISAEILAKLRGTHRERIPGEDDE